MKKNIWISLILIALITAIPFIIKLFHDKESTNSDNLNEYVTRAELAKILVSSFELTEDTEYTYEERINNDRKNKIDDLDATCEEYDYINIAISYFNLYYENNKIYFKPEIPITREDMAQIVVLKLELDDVDTMNKLLEGIPTKDIVAKEREIYLDIAIKKGLMKENSDIQNNPNGYMTLDEVNQIMDNVKNELNKINEILFTIKENNYTIHEFESFSKIVNYEKGDINKQMTEEETLSMMDEFLLRKIYLIAAINHNIALESGDTSNISSDYEKNKELYTNANISIKDYTKYAEEKELVEALKENFGEYYELPNEIYEEYKKYFVDINDEKEIKKILLKEFADEIVTNEIGYEINQKAYMKLINK